MDEYEGRNGAIDTEQAGSKARRRFLKKAGKFALYTTPAVMMLMKPSFASNMQKGSWMGRPQHSRHREHQHSWKPVSKRFREHDR